MPLDGECIDDIGAADAVGEGDYVRLYAPATPELAESNLV